MPRKIRAVFENGVLRPLEKVDLREDQEVEIAILDEGEDDLSAASLARLAEEGGAFDFLKDPREDVYSPDEGEEV